MKYACQLLIFTAILCLFSGCKKNKETDSQLILDDKNLSECPKSGSCSFQYVNNANMVRGQLTFTTGQHRIFWAKMQAELVFRSFYFQAPMLGDKFVLDQVDIAAGRVYLESGCPTCFSVNAQPVDGTVKGIRVPATAISPEHWLVEANLIMPSKETITVKQYFFESKGL